MISTVTFLRAVTKLDSGIQRGWRSFNIISSAGTSRYGISLRLLTTTSPENVEEKQQIRSTLMKYIREDKGTAKFFQVLLWGADSGIGDDEEIKSLRAALYHTFGENQDELRRFLLDFNENLPIEYLFSRANLLLALGELVEAKKHYENAFSKMVEELGPDHPNVASSLASRAIIHFNQLEFSEALELYRKALDIEIKHFGDDHIQVAQSSHNVGVTYLELHQLEEAKQAINKAIEIKRKHYQGEPSADLAVSLSVLGSILLAEGNLDLARLALEEVAHIQEKCAGDNSPEVVDNLIEISNIASAQGLPDDALENLLRAVEILKSTSNGPTLQLANLLEMIGSLQQEVGRNDAAAQSFRDSYDNYVAVSTNIDKDVNVARIKLNVILFEMEKRPVNEIIDGIQNVIATYRNCEIDKDISLALALHTLGAALVKQGKPTSEAMEYFEKALNMRKWILGPESELVGDSLNDIGYIHLSHLQFADAEKHLLEAIKVYSACFPGEVANKSPKLALAYYYLGNASLMLNNQVDAGRHFAKALTMSRSALGDDHPQVKSLEKIISEYFPQQDNAS